MFLTPPLAPQQAAATASNAAAGMENPNFLNGWLRFGNAVDEKLTQATNAGIGISNLAGHIVTSGIAGAADIAHNVANDTFSLSQIGDIKNPNVYPNLAEANASFANGGTYAPVTVGSKGPRGAYQGRVPQEISSLSPKLDPRLLQAMQVNPKLMEIYRKDPDHFQAVLDQYQKQAAAQAAQQAPLPAQGL